MGLWGAGGVKNFSVGICDGAPSTARSSLNSDPDRRSVGADLGSNCSFLQTTKVAARINKMVSRGIERINS